MSLAFLMVPSAEVLSRACHVALLLMSSYLLDVCLYLRTVGVMPSSPPHSQCLQLCQPAKTVDMLTEDMHVAAIHLPPWETSLSERMGLFLTATYIAGRDENRCNVGLTAPPAGR